MKDRIRPFQIANVVLFLGTVGCLICYDIFGALWLKGLTSTWFVALGLTNLRFARVMGLTERGTLRWILLGLIFGMLADVLLELVFLLGVVSFALGHLCYLIAFFRLEKPCRRDLMCILPWGILSLIGCLCNPFIRIEDPVMRKFLLVYAVILGTMVGKALSNFLAEKSAFRVVLLVGSLMFWFSDLMLGIDMFGTPSRLTWVLCSYCYWPAQAITAHAIYHRVLENPGENR